MKPKIDIKKHCMSEHLTADNYEAGAIWPMLEIVNVTEESVKKGAPIEVCLYLKGAPAPWMVSSKVTKRELAKTFGDWDGANWIGNSVQIKIIGGVKNPGRGGEKGNGFRIAKALKKQPEKQEAK